MTGTRHRKPRPLTNLAAWLVLGLAPGWVWPSAVLAADSAVGESGTLTYDEEADASNQETGTLEQETDASNQETDASEKETDIPDQKTDASDQDDAGIVQNDDGDTASEDEGESNTFTLAAAERAQGIQASVREFTLISTSQRNPDRYWINPDGPFKAGQTFRYEKPLIVTSIRVSQNDVPSTLVLQDGSVEKGTKIADAYKADHTGGSEGYTRYRFDTPQQLMANHLYSFVVEMPQYARVYSALNNPYPGDDLCAEFDMYYGGGWNRTLATNQDLLFEIWGEAITEDPYVKTNTGLSLWEGDAAAIETHNLEADDPDDEWSHLQFTVIAPPAYGELRKDGIRLTAGDTFIQQDLHDGRISYAHRGGEEPGDSFTFTVDDGCGGQVGPETFNITVKPVNDPPVFNLAGDVRVNEDSGEYAQANFMTGLSAVEPGQEITTVTVSVAKEDQALFAVQPEININENTGALTFTPALDAYGSAEVTVTVQDDGRTENGGADTTEKTFTITIAPVNDPPSFNLAGDVIVDRDYGTYTSPAPFLTDLNAVEPDQEITDVTVSVAEEEKGLFAVQPAIDQGTGVLTFATAPGVTGTAEVRVTVKDSGGTENGGEDTTEKTFAITVLPILKLKDVTVPEDAGPYEEPGFLDVLWFTGGDQTLAVTVSVPEEEKALFAVAPAIDLTTGKLTFVPAQDANGTAHVTAAVQDDDGREADVPFAIMITPVNDAPVAQGQRLSVTRGRTYNGRVTAADIDGDALTYVLVAGPLKGSLTLNADGAFSYAAESTGTDSFTFKANDGTEDSNVATVTVYVTRKSNRRSGGSSGSSGEPAAPEEPAGVPEEETTEDVNSPVIEQIDPGEAAEVRMGSFQVSLPSESVGAPLLLQLLFPTANTDAVRLAEGAAELVATGDVDLTNQADGTPVLAVSAAITFEYDPSVVSNPEELRIFYFDTKQNVWVEIGGEVDTEAHTISVHVSHFTTFAALVPRSDAPVLPELPVEVASDELIISGTAPAGTSVTLVINGDLQATVMTDENGRYTMEGTLAEGQNWVYVKGTGALASREWSVTYQPAVSYTDISGHWAEETISRLAELGIATVYSAPLFEPEAKVNRLEFAVMVSRVLGLTPVEDAPAFTDTALMPEWALPEVAAAYWAGIIRGMADGSFAPDRLVNRAEMAVMLTRALEYAGKDTTPGDHRFADHETIPNWAKEHVHVAARWGLITGYTDGSFQPGNDTTRAEAVTMLERLLDQVSE